MLKCVIVEDEPRICQMLCILIEWERLGLSFAGKADNGPDAFNLILEQVPDIVITDIRIPGFNGLEMIESVKAILPDIEFVIISGYQDFSYAQRAISLGVNEYLLKPIDEDKLNQVLHQMAEKLNKRHMATSLLAEHRSTIERQKSQLFQRFCNDLMDNHVGGSDVDTLNTEYSLNLVSGWFQIFIVHPKGTQTGLNSVAEEKQKLIVEIIHKLFSVVDIQPMTFLRNESVYCILNGREDRGNIQRIELLRREVSNLFPEHMHIQVCVGVSGVAEKVGLLHRLLLQATDALRCRMELGMDRVISYSKLPLPQQKDIAVVLSPENQRRFRVSVESGNVAELSEVLKEIFLPTDPADLSHDPLFWLTVVQMLFEEYILSLKHTAEPDEELFLRFRNIQDRSLSIIALQRNFETMLVRHLSDRVASAMNREPQSIRTAKSYIQMHYRDTCLDEIAAQVNLSPVYFSGVFKKECGQTVQDYITACRLDEAKRLLRETNMNVLEISEAVGYSGAKYFSKLFHKQLGLTPSEYRRLYS